MSRTVKVKRMHEIIPGVPDFSGTLARDVGAKAVRHAFLLSVSAGYTPIDKLSSKPCVEHFCY